MREVHGSKFYVRGKVAGYGCVDLVESVYAYAMHDTLLQKNDKTMNKLGLLPTEFLTPLPPCISQHHEQLT